MRIAWSSVLGARSEDRAFLEFLVSVESNAELISYSDHIGVRTIEIFGKGIEIELGEDSVVEAVFLTVAPSGIRSSCPFELPFGLDSSMNQSEVRALLGVPHRTGSPAPVQAQRSVAKPQDSLRTAVVQALSSGGLSWDEWERSNLVTVVYYKCNGHSISTIALIRVREGFVN